MIPDRRAAARRGLVLCAFLALTGVSAVRGQEEPQRRPPGGRVDTTSVERAVRALHPKYFTTYDQTQQRRTWNQELEIGYERGLWSVDGGSKFEVQNDLYQDATTRTGRFSLTTTNRAISRLPLTLRVTYDRTNFEGQDSRDDISTSALLGLTHTRRVLGGMQTLRLEGGLEGQEQENFNRNTSLTALTSNDGVVGTLNWNGNSRPTDWAAFTGRGTYSRSAMTSRTTNREASTSDETKILNGELVFTPLTPLSIKILGNTDEKDYVNSRSVSGVDAFVTTDTKRQNLDLTTTYVSPWGIELEAGAGVYENSTFLRPDVDDENLQQLVRQSNTKQGNSWSVKLTGETWGADYETSLTSNFDETIKVNDDPSELISNRWEGRATKDFGTNAAGRPKFITKANWHLELRQQKDITSPRRRFDFDEKRTKLALGTDWDMNDRWTVGLLFESSGNDRYEQNPRRATSTTENDVQSLTTTVDYTLSEKTRIKQIYSIVADFRERLFETSRNSSTISRRVTTDIFTQVIPKVDLNVIHRWSQLETSSFIRSQTRGLVIFPESKTWTQDLRVTLNWKVFPWLTWVSEEQLIRRDFLTEVDQVKTLLSRDFRLIQGINLNKELGMGFRVSGQGRYQRSNVRASYVTINARLDKEF